MLARAALLLACVVVVALLWSARDDHRACDQARRDLFGVVLGSVAADREAPALEALGERCRGTEGLVAASAALHRAGKPLEAIRYARRATREEPQSATAWNALATVAAQREPALAADAAARARRLSPLETAAPARP